MIFFIRHVAIRIKKFTSTNEIPFPSSSYSACYFSWHNMNSGTSCAYVYCAPNGRMKMQLCSSAVFFWLNFARSEVNLRKIVQIFPPPSPPPRPPSPSRQSTVVLPALFYRSLAKAVPNLSVSLPRPYLSVAQTRPLQYINCCTR